MEITSKKIFKKTVALIISIILLIAFMIIGLNKITIINTTYIIITLLVSIVFASLAILFKYLQFKNQIRYFYYQIIDFLVMLNFALLLIQIFFVFAFFPATVYKSSMYPTLKEYDKLLVKSTEKVQRFDIVVLMVDEEINTLFGGVVDDELLVKRVIAVEGDTFYFSDGFLYLNGELINEEYLKDEYGNFLSDGLVFNTRVYNFTINEKCRIGGVEQCTPDEECKIPKDYIFVLGDNREFSIDSRTLGLFHKSQIIGVAKYKQLGLLKWVKL